MGRREAVEGGCGGAGAWPERPGGARNPFARNTGGTVMTNRNPSRSARALLLAGPTLALSATICSLATGSGLRHLGIVWACAALWSLLTALSCVLWRGLRHGDWSAFGRYELPDARGERFDWATRTGRYAWRRDDEERELHAHDDYPGHGPIT